MALGNGQRSRQGSRPHHPCSRVNRGRTRGDDDTRTSRQGLDAHRGRGGVRKAVEVECRLQAGTTEMIEQLGACDPWQALANEGT